MASYTNIPPSSSGALTTNSTLTGNGTAGSPLGVNPAATLAPDWIGYCSNLFLEKTGLAAIKVATIFASDMMSPLTTAQLGFAASGGSGATANYNNAVTAGGGAGVITVTGPNAAAGNIQWGGTDVAGHSPIANIAAKRWAVFRRWAVNTAPAATSSNIMGVYAAKYIGVGYVGAKANYWWGIGTAGAPASTFDTGAAINSAGNVYYTQYVGNFDLANVKFNPDVEGAAADITVDSVASLPSAQGYPIWATVPTGTPTVETFQFDAIAAFCER